MRGDDEDSGLREDLGPQRKVIMGGIVAAVVAAAVIFGLLAFRSASRPRQPRQPDLSQSADAGRRTPSTSDSESRNRRTQLGPLSVPDGGWPEAPASLDQMDEIPQGTLLQGSAGDSAEEDETPAGDVLLSAFYIDRYETTNEQYRACVDAGVCRPPLQLKQDQYGAPRQPAVGVSWYDATTFCQWAGKRLPTEAEWERAARGDDRRLYPWGGKAPACELAVHTNCDRYGPAEVGGRPEGAGPYGTQDLAGNVWEWVQDWYAPRYYPSGPEGDPVGPPAGQQRVLRGGSWHFGPEYVRAANRHRDDPAHRTPWYGFRCAYRPPPPPPPVTPPHPSPDAGLDSVQGTPGNHGARDAGRTPERSPNAGDARPTAP